MKYLLFAICLIGLGIAASSFDEEYFAKYDNYAVYEVDTQSVEAGLLKKLEEILSGPLSYWKEPTKASPFAHIMIAGDKREFFEHTLIKLNIAYKLLIENVGTLVRQQIEANSRISSGGNDDFDYGKYHTLDEINNWMVVLENTYPKYLTVFNVSHSYQQRDIYALKISIPNASKKPAIWIDGGIHAREWISPATVIYMAYSLVSNYSVDPDITSILNKFDIYVLPVFNVDGYEFTWSKDRLWRKTRSRTKIPTCLGADPNRNWDADFCGPDGASKDPCSETYCGEKAFSESEVRGVAEFLAKNNDTIVSYMNFHSYSQLWMSPYGYTANKPKDFNAQDGGSAAAVEALTKVYGTQYEHGNIATTIYVATGGSVDWTYDTAKILYSYAIELRDQGQYGFLLPPEQIIPSGIETFEGLKALIFYIAQQIEK